MDPRETDCDDRIAAGQIKKADNATLLLLIMSAMRTLVAVGACYVDLILRYLPNKKETGPINSGPVTDEKKTSVDHYPGEDEKLRASRLARRRGGNCPNTVEVLEQLIQTKKEQQKEKNDFEPLSPVLVAVLPAQSSPAVQFVRDSFGPGVDLTHCLYRESFHEPASSYIISSQATGSRTIVNYNELTEMTHDEFNALIDRLDLRNSGDGTWFHFEVNIYHLLAYAQTELTLLLYRAESRMSTCRMSNPFVTAYLQLRSVSK